MKPANLKIWSIISLILTATTILYHLVAILQVKFQMDSDFIPNSVFWELTSQNLGMITITILAGLIALLFHKKAKYLIVLVICATSYIGQQIYLFLS